MKKCKTNRGFRLYTFKDVYNDECSLQESSRADQLNVWLGLDTHEIKTHHVTGEPLGVRMCLNQKLARQIGLKLIAFAETGII